MGILRIMSHISNNLEICRPVSIEALVESYPRRKVVVDENVFLCTYVVKHYQWIVGGTTELAESIRRFVKSFNDLGIRLIFIFEESCMYDNGEGSWEKHRAQTVEYVTSVLRDVSQKVDMIHIDTKFMKAHMFYDLQCWIPSLLRELNCEVFCFLNNRVWHIANHARSDDCLAILSQSSYFLFFASLKALFFSLACLDLRNMTTRMFSRNALAASLHLNKTFFPLLATLLGGSHREETAARRQVFHTIRQRGYIFHDSRPSLMVSKFIMENYDALRLNDVSELLQKHFPKNAEFLVKKYSEYKNLFNLEFDDLENEPTKQVALNNWEKIKVKCQELLRTGLLCRRVYSVIHDQTYEQRATLEDFVDLPSCNAVYKRLRKQMYAILLHEATDFLETVEVREWCIEGGNHPNSPVVVLPDHVNPSLHPGLLALWDFTNETHDLVEKKWKLFAAAVSPSLDYRTLRDLPKSLVIPVALLHYLFRISFKSPLLEPLLKPWEVEVFIYVALRLPHSDKDILGSLFINQGNTRAVNLSGIYFQGCDILNLLTQSCGLELGKQYTSIWNFFDGKLFHNLYERASSGSVIINSTSELFVEFNSIRSLIFECVSEAHNS